MDSDGEEMSEEESEEEESTDATPARQKKKTLKDRNRQAKHRLMEEEMEKKQREKRQRKDLENLKKIEEDVEQILTAREERLKRRNADKEELAKSQPPRLGKHRFEPLPIQVMTTEEIRQTGGSLRKIKPTSMLTKERYKSLQRRGVVEPRVKVNKKGGKRKVVIHGQRADNAQERQNEIKKLKKTNSKKK